MSAVVKPVHFRTERPDLDCIVSRVVGFRAIERDVWAGPFRRSYRAAQSDARERNKEARRREHA